MADPKILLPRSTIRRLSKYLLFVRRHCDENGVDYISSQYIADALGLTSATVRRDLSCVDFFGTPKRGYKADDLAVALCDFLAADESHRVILAGAGNLGRALAMHQGFARHGFIISGVYDRDTQIIGKRFGDLVIRDMDQMVSDIEKDKIRFGILAVPGKAAQEVADLMISAGTRGILNLSLTHLIAPAHISVVDSQIVADLQELVFLVRESGGDNYCGELATSGRTDSAKDAVGHDSGTERSR